jgi:hypothetical protein
MHAAVRTSLVVALACASCASIGCVSGEGSEGHADELAETGVYGGGNGCEVPPPDPECYVCVDGSWQPKGGYPGATTLPCDAPSPPKCPAIAPTIGAQCADLFDCEYVDTCAEHPVLSDGFDHFTCDDRTNTWQISNAYPLTECPAAIPRVGSPCSCGRHFHAPCEYAGDCSVGLGDALVVCNHDTGLWMIERASCPSADAGASGDADAAP